MYVRAPKGPSRSVLIICYIYGVAHGPWNHFGTTLEMGLFGQGFVFTRISPGFHLDFTLPKPLWNHFGTTLEIRYFGSHQYIYK